MEGGTKGLGKGLDYLFKHKKIRETETVFCFMFKSNNFQLYADMLQCLLDARKNDRSVLENKFYSQDIKSQKLSSQLECTLKAHLEY